MRLTLAFSLMVCCLPVLAQNPAAPPSPPPANSAPVPYASVSQVNLLLAQVEQTSQSIQRDLAALRIDKWKTGANTKEGSRADVGSIQRNLQTALPAIIAELRRSPESLPSTFKLYRNLDALYDVFASLAESTGAFGSRDEYQALQNDVDSLETSRRMFADRVQTLADAKESELTGLRTELQKARAIEQTSTPSKKVVVDDTEPPAKPPKKKSSHRVPKPPAKTTPNPDQTAPPAANPPPQ